METLLVVCLCVSVLVCHVQVSAFAQDTTEPRANGGQCPANEEYQSCGTCTRTCENPNPICPAQCISGCFCIEGRVRNREGKCVRPDQCPSAPKPIQYQITCREHQVYKQCETCEKTCSNPNPKCPTPCAMGCFCEEGFVKSPNGQCVRLDDCPKAEVMVGPMGHDSQEPEIEDCAPDEEYFSCGWCEPSCSNPSPSCPIRVCTRGCLCRPPLLRHHSGHCVEEKDCFPQKCKDPNEEYVCRYGCELRCETRACVRPRRCLLGCHCRLGLVRDGATGFCVTRDKCLNTTNTNDISFD
ncbi:mucin-5B-like isoform X2 [Trichoplusia ni]|uniref:Mucin-5B-like isoform X2 n=1 Tax=Trichoplusia ni TaxID=7111 RepID=A0A7E5VX79_TRINI|nr:mucin-5B-like isoform X2 [Trichoplusia ni]